MWTSPRIGSSKEALTIAIKHAGPTSVQVVLRYRPEELQLDIVHTGAGVGAGEGAGHGLVGMRERVVSSARPGGLPMRR